jgi:hypothetical protein
MKVTSNKFISASGMGTAGLVFTGLSLVVGGFLWMIGAPVIGGVFAAAGVLLGTMRWMFEIDRQEMKLTQRYGLFRPFLPTASKFISGATGILLVKQPWRGHGARQSSSDSESYYIDLEHPAGNIRVEHFSERKEGRDTAVRLGEWLNLPVQSVEYQIDRHFNLMIKSIFRRTNRYGKPVGRSDPLRH